MPSSPTSTLYPLLLASTAISSLFLLYTYISKPHAETRPSAISPLSARLSRSPLSHPHSSNPAPSLPYPPDALPGARDVDSPYGWMRVYEWGPEDGRKVLLVHGISTPCIALADVARRLVARGCRVCLFDIIHPPLSTVPQASEASCFPPTAVSSRHRNANPPLPPDLWGRGWSDTPRDLPHDARLYASQILIALASSPLSWTGARSGRFSLIGYSLGGGIAMSFAACFPHLLASIVLLAPSGILRVVHADYQNPLLRYHWLFPRSWVRWQVRRILCGDNAPPVAERPHGDGRTVRDAADREVLLQEELAPEAPSLVNIADIIRWQVECNEGFVRSFISGLRNAPTAGQERHWRTVGQNLTRAREDAEWSRASTAGPPCSRILIVAGESDPFVIVDELIADATQLLGAGNLEVRTIDDGHEFPINRAGEVVDYISEFWDLEQLDHSA
ncbi:hypothetical protein MMC11_007802 [Xylographa trunciseda]|nr:hypothetical protein [Xylographa trunciseda]